MEQIITEVEKNEPKASINRYMAYMDAAKELSEKNEADKEEEDV